MKNKAKPGIYSNGNESFRIGYTDKEDVMTFQALTNISYLPLKHGNTIHLGKKTIESLINDEDLGFNPLEV